MIYPEAASPKKQGRMASASALFSPPRYGFTSSTVTRIADTVPETWSTCNPDVGS
jgi:hypothetical protein